MIKLSAAVLFFVAALFIAPANILAADLGKQPQIKAEVVSRVGDSVRFFHGGTEEAKKLFCKNEVVPVYRYVGRYEKTKEVGKVKLGDFVGGHYIEGIVVEGEVKPGDVAMKQNAACLAVEKMLK